MKKETLYEQLLRLYKEKKVDEIALEDAVRKRYITDKQKELIIKIGVR